MQRCSNHRENLRSEETHKAAKIPMLSDRFSDRKRHTRDSVPRCEVEKVGRNTGVLTGILHIFACACAFRHSRVQFLDI